MNQRICGVWLALALLATGIWGTTGCNRTEPGTRVAGESVDLSGVPQPEDRRAPESSNGLELDLISDLFFAGFVLHPQQMLASESITADQVRAFLGEWADSESVPLERCQRILVLLPMVGNREQQMLPVVKLEFDGSVDLAAILNRDDQQLLRRAEQTEGLWTEPKGRSAAYQYSSHALLFGEREYVMAAVEDRLPRAGRLAELMGQLKLDRDVVGVMNGEALATMASGLQPGANGQSMMPPTAFEFSLSLSDDPLGLLTVDVASEEEAKAVKDQFGRSLQMTKMMGPLLVQSIASDAPTQTRTLLSKVFKDITSGVQVGVDGRRVTVSVARPDDLPQAIAGLANLVIEARQVEQREKKLEQVAQAMLKYHDENEQFPFVAQRAGQPDVQGLSWRVYLLPMLGKQELFDRFHLDESWDSEHNKTLISEMPEVFDTIGETGATTLVILRGTQTAWTLDKATSIKDILDGTVQTIMLIDAGPEKSVIWTQPDELMDDPEKPLLQLGITRVPSMIVATFDGKTHRISRNVSEKDIRALLSPRGEEKIDYRSKLGIPDPDQKTRGMPTGGFPFGGFN